MPVPETVQPTYTPRPRIRGILPVPRDIFDKRRGGTERYSEEYFANIQKDRLKPLGVSPNDPQAARNEWKARASAQRRENLRSGVLDLQRRRHRTLEKHEYARAMKTMNFEYLRAEREARQDVRLTSPSISQNMQPQVSPLRAAKNAEKEAMQARWLTLKDTMTPVEFDRMRYREQRELAAKFRDHKVRAKYLALDTGIPDPNREERLAAMRARVEEKEARRLADRKDALHTLYMHARNFIINETQLDGAIEKAFGTPQEPRQFGYRGVSIWNRQGAFENVQDRLNAANRTTGSRLTQMYGDEGFTGLTQGRLKRLAEELTGGKM